ncbi:hypothetical protein DY000_02056520 [Brassica cretica]|uniref:Uncharacterized protein n=1 Tax=Brassica cretica TaxID=69181 RepID=A0ABQ7ADW4_BRACR|nr:hypothetical protein DY000_02056520 [Brassica cretica]
MPKFTAFDSGGRLRPASNSGALQPAEERSTWVIALITLMLRALTSLYMYCFDSANVKGVVVHKATIGMNYLIE